MFGLKVASGLVLLKGHEGESVPALSLAG
jgi:hypothetical protein